MTETYSTTPTYQKTFYSEISPLDFVRINPKFIIAIKEEIKNYHTALAGMKNKIEKLNKKRKSN